MNKKATLDMAIVISCITGMVLSYVYLENVLQKQVSLTLPRSSRSRISDLMVCRLCKIQAAAGAWNGKNRNFANPPVGGRQ